MHFTSKLSAYTKLLRLHKPIGIFLLLWPTLWALWIAGEGHPNRYIVLVFILGCVLMRSAGCAINDFADRNFDKHVSRTKNRPLASGEITSPEAITLFIILSLVSFGLVLTLNTFTIFLSFITVALVALYPFTKRYTHWPQAVLGVAFAMSIPMAFAAQTNHLPLICWFLFSIALLWTLIYDTLYAMADREEDRPLGIKSTALLFDENDKKIILLLQILFLISLIFLGIWQHFSWVFYCALGCVSMLILYQQHLIRDRHPQQCFKAFLNNQWIGSIIFAGILFS